MEELLNLNLRDFCDRLMYRRNDIGPETIEAYLAKRTQNNPYALFGLLFEVQNLIGDYYRLLADTQEGANPYEKMVKALIREIENDWNNLNLDPFQTDTWKAKFGEVFGKNNDEELAMEEYYDLYYVFKLREGLRQRISERQTMHKPGRGRPPKSILHTYTCRFDKDTLRIIFNRLRPAYIPGNSAWGGLLLAFSEAPIEDIAAKINWLKSKSQLFYLLRQMIDTEPFDPAIANYCFTNKGKPLKLAHNDKPQNGYSELDKLLEV